MSQLFNSKAVVIIKNELLRIEYGFGKIFKQKMSPSSSGKYRWMWVGKFPTIGGQDIVPVSNSLYTYCCIESQLVEFIHRLFAATINSLHCFHSQSFLSNDVSSV